MLIVCPTCASAYALDPARIGPAGRRVRCAACRESWDVAADPAVEEPSGEPAAEEPSPPAPAERSDAPDPWPAPPPEPLAERAPVVIDAERARATTARAPRPVSRRRKPARGRGGWFTPGASLRRRAAFAALLLAALAPAAAVAGRASIVGAVPQSAALFAAIGLPVNLVGLDLARVTSAVAETGGKPELTVEGQITNPGSRERPVPPIEIAVRSEDGALLYAWTVAAQDAVVAGGGTTPFRARLASPPPAGRSVAVTFRAAPAGAVVALR